MNHEPTPTQPTSSHHSRKGARVALAAALTLGVGAQIVHDQATHQTGANIYNPLTWIATPLEHMVGAAHEPAPVTPQIPDQQLPPITPKTA